MERAREANRSAAAASGISLHLRPSNPGKYILISLFQAYFDIGGGVTLELRLVVFVEVEFMFALMFWGSWDRV